ncbi:MAG: hypothetical protein R3F17_04795 [Planctomycetota bacterium]
MGSSEGSALQLAGRDPVALDGLEAHRGSRSAAKQSWRALCVALILALLTGSARASAQAGPEQVNLEEDAYWKSFHRFLDAIECGAEPDKEAKRAVWLLPCLKYFQGDARYRSALAEIDLVRVLRCAARSVELEVEEVLPHGKLELAVLKNAGLAGNPDGALKGYRFLEQSWGEDHPLRPLLHVRRADLLRGQYHDLKGASRDLLVASRGIDKMAEGKQKTTQQRQLLLQRILLAVSFGLPDTVEQPSRQAVVEFRQVLAEVEREGLLDAEGEVTENASAAFYDWIDALRARIEVALALDRADLAREIATELEADPLWSEFKQWRPTACATIELRLLRARVGEVTGGVRMKAQI